MMMPLIQKEQSAFDVKKTAAKIGVGLAVVCVVALVAVGSNQQKGTEVVSAKNMAETLAVSEDNWTSESSCRNYCYDTFYRKFYNYPNYLRCEQMCFYGKYSHWSPHSSSCMTTCHSASGNGDCHAICYPPLLMESPKKVGGEKVEKTEEGEDAQTEKATSVAVSKDNWTSENGCRSYCYDTFYRKFYNYPNYLRCEQMCFSGRYSHWTPHTSSCMTVCHSASGTGDCHAICYPPLLAAPKKADGEEQEEAEEEPAEKKTGADAAKGKSVAVTKDNWTSENSCRSFCYDTFYRKFYNYPNYLRCEQMCFSGRYSHWTPHTSSCMTVCHSASGTGDCHAICYPPLMMAPKKVGGEKAEQADLEKARPEAAKKMSETKSVAVTGDNWTSESSCRNFCYDAFYRRNYNYPNYLQCEQMCFNGRYSHWAPHSSMCITVCHSVSGSGNCNTICTSS